MEIKDKLAAQVDVATKEVINKEDSYLDNIKDTLKNTVSKEQYEKETKRLREDNEKLSSLVSELVKGKANDTRQETQEREYKEIYNDLKSGTQLKPKSNLEMVKLIVETAVKVKNEYGTDLIPEDRLDNYIEAIELAEGNKDIFNGIMKTRFPAQGTKPRMTGRY